ncbi:MAG TPA: hypothetical protein DCL48_08505 [Alphaproteobacteria bacterium]|nr:hypothetical protein [Alphaproteobacteria bacterium]
MAQRSSNWIWAVLICLGLGLAACGERRTAVKEEGPPEPVPMGQLGPDVTPTAYRLDLRIIPTEPQFGGQVEIDVDVARHKQTVYLHARDLTLETVSARLPDGEVIAGAYEKATETGVAKLTFASAIPKGAATLVFKYSGKLGDKPDTLWVAEEAGERYAATQFQPLGARKAFPSFDEPRFKTPYTITLTTRESDVAASNAAVAKVDKIEGGLKRTTFAPTQPLPTYLVAMFAGPYDVVEAPAIPASAVRPEPIPLRGLTVKGKGTRMAYALKHTAPMIAYLEEYFATAYPYGKLDIIAPPNFSAGGMENAGAITYAERVILLDETASAAVKARFFMIHAHELGHQWFGDLVTPKWWDDLWLNESFASWIEIKTAAAVAPGNAYERGNLRDAIKVMDLDSLDTARAIRQPIAADDDIYNAFDGLTYSKGAAVLAMFEAFVGEEAFREGVRVHMKRYAHGVATAQDFLKSLADGSKRPEIVDAFETFLTQPGVPFVRAKITCDKTIGKGEFRQGPFAPLGVEAKPKTWSVPLCLRNLNRNEPQQCAMVSAQAADVVLLDVCPQPALLLNSGGNGYYRFDVGPEGWLNMIAKASVLSASEQISLLDSARAAFLSGGLDAKTYWRALETFAKAEAFDAVGAVADAIGELRDKFVSVGDQAAFERRVRSLYAPAVSSASLTTPSAESVLGAQRREALISAAAYHARDPALLKALSDQGAKALAEGPQAVDANLLPASLWAFVHLGGAPSVEAVIAKVKASSDATFRSTALRALAGLRGEAAFKPVGDLLLSGDLRTRERADLVRALFEDGEVRAMGWAFVKANFEALAAKTTLSGRALYIRVTDGFCDEATRADVEAFFTPKVAQMPGAPRSLANTLERIGRCVRLAEAKTAEVKTLWAAAPVAAPVRQRRRR